MGLQTREKTHREVYSTSNTSLAHATVKKKRVTVLLVQTGHDAEHLGPANDNEEHSARRNAEENQPGACHRRGRRRARQREGREEVRGVRLFLLFFLFLLLLACSNKILASNAEAVRKRKEEESTTSPADPARTGRASRQAVPCGAPQAAVAPLRPRVNETAPAVPPVEASASRKPPPPLSSLPSVPVGLRASQAPHHGCDAGPRRAPMRQSAARVEATSAAVAAASASQSQRNHGRVQHKSHPLGFETSRLHKQGNACLSQTPGGGGGADQV